VTLCQARRWFWHAALAFGRRDSLLLRGGGRVSYREPDTVTDASPAGDAVLPVGQLGHGLTASLRRQPARRVEGRAEGGYTGAFELICGDCGDHLYLDYSEVSPRLRRIRGPYTMAAGLAAYEEHLGRRIPGGLEQLQLAGAADRLVSAGRAQLAEDALQVALDRIDRDEHLRCDLGCAQQL
jgi:hypothetical protein